MAFRNDFDINASLKGWVDFLRAVFFSMLSPWQTAWLICIITWKPTWRPLWIRSIRTDQSVTLFSHDNQKQAWKLIHTHLKISLHVLKIVSISILSFVWTDILRRLRKEEFKRYIFARDFQRDLEWLLTTCQVKPQIYRLQFNVSLFALAKEFLVKQRCFLALKKGDLTSLINRQIFSFDLL